MPIITSIIIRVEKNTFFNKAQPGATLNNATDYQTKGPYRTPNLKRSPLAQYSDSPLVS